MCGILHLFCACDTSCLHSSARIKTYSLNLQSNPKYQHVKRITDTKYSKETNCSLLTIIFSHQRTGDCAYLRTLEALLLPRQLPWGYEPRAGGSFHAIKVGPEVDTQHRVMPHIKANLVGIAQALAACGWWVNPRISSNCGAKIDSQWVVRGGLDNAAACNRWIKSIAQFPRRWHAVWDSTCVIATHFQAVTVACSCELS